VGNVLEHHTLQSPGDIGADSFASQDHLSIFEFADKIQIAAFVVHPGLFPFARGSVEDGNAPSAQVHGVAAGKSFLDDATVKNAPDAIGAVCGLSGVVARPGEIPFAHPEFQLLLFRF